MACLGLLGCNHAHRSAGSYILIALLAFGIALVLRILLYAIARWLQQTQQHGPTAPEEGGGVEMQAAPPVSYGNTQQCRRTPTLDYSCHAQKKAVAQIRHRGHPMP